MHRSPVRTILIAATVSAGFASATVALAQDKSMQLHQSMMKSMQQMQSMPMTGDVDKDFAMMMKHHHQSGIDMAQIEARNGNDPELRQQAQKIIESQKKEMAELDKWTQSKGAAGGTAKPSDSQSGHSHSGAAK